ncbi:hypothetical protein XANCAGTX0491_002963 [Xanthoria calcicola]
MSQPTPSLNPNRKSLRAPGGRARLIKKQSSALSLRTPTPPARFSTTPTATAAAPTSTSKTHTSKRLSTHSLRSLVHKKSTRSLASNRIRGPSPSPSPSISAPAPQRQVLRLSDILDPEELIREQRSLSSTPAPPGTPLSPDDEFPTLLQATESGGEARRLVIHSPSGARLDAEAFALRKDRPLTVGERQRRIREEMTRQVDDERRVGLERAMRKQGRMACCRVM